MRVFFQSYLLNAGLLGCTPPPAVAGGSESTRLAARAATAPPLPPPTPPLPPPQSAAAAAAPFNDDWSARRHCRRQQRRPLSPTRRTPRRLPPPTRPHPRCYLCKDIHRSIRKIAPIIRQESGSSPPCCSHSGALPDRLLAAKRRQMRHAAGKEAYTVVSLESSPLRQNRPLGLLVACGCTSAHHACQSALVPWGRPRQPNAAVRARIPQSLSGGKGRRSLRRVQRRRHPIGAPGRPRPASLLVRSRRGNHPWRRP